MRELILLAATAYLGWHCYTLHKQVENLEQEKKEMIVEHTNTVERNIMIAREAQKEMEASLIEASELGLKFKYELDQTRSQLEDVEGTVFSLRGQLHKATSSKARLQGIGDGFYVWDLPQ